MKKRIIEIARSAEVVKSASHVVGNPQSILFVRVKSILSKRYRLNIYDTGNFHS